MLKLSFLNLFRKKSRTILALSGMMVGVAAMLSMIAVVDGMFADFEELVGQLQGVMVREKDVADEIFSNLDVSYAEEFEKIKGVRVAVPMYYVAPTDIDGKQPSSMSLTSPAMIYGVDVARLNKMRGSGFVPEVEKGGDLREGGNGYVLIGSQIAKDFTKFAGSSIKINNKRFKVRGILRETSQTLNGIIVMSLNDTSDISGNDVENVNFFYLELENPEDDKRVAQTINFKFDEVHARTSSDYSEELGSIVGNFRLVALIVALISAFVAAIGIINTVLMSVLERFGEIGALKAVGWANSDVMKMIVLESAFIGVLGGAAGILFGLLVVFATETVLGLPTRLSPELMVQAFTFAVGVGLLAGIYPAYRASRLDPVEALRS